MAGACEQLPRDRDLGDVEAVVGQGDQNGGDGPTISPPDPQLGPHHDRPHGPGPLASTGWGAVRGGRHGPGATTDEPWADSVCDDDAAPMSAHQRDLRLHTRLIWVVGAGVPVLIAAAARRRNGRIWPWTIVAGVFLSMALFQA
jgi:hypothetical protein